MSDETVYRALRCPNCSEVIPFSLGGQPNSFRFPIHLDTSYQLTCPKCKAVSTIDSRDAFDTRFDEPLAPGELEAYRDFVRGNG